MIENVIVMMLAWRIAHQRNGRISGRASSIEMQAASASLKQHQ